MAKDLPVDFVILNPKLLEGMVDIDDKILVGGIDYGLEVKQWSAHSRAKKNGRV